MYNSDVDYPFYQESFFFYLFGVNEKDCYGLIDLETRKTVLFLPNYDVHNKIQAHLWSIKQWKQEYSSIDEFWYIKDIPTYFKNRQPQRVYLNHGKTDVFARSTILPDQSLFKDTCPNATVDKYLLYRVLTDSRVLKTAEEIEIMRWASRATCEA